MRPPSAPHDFGVAYYHARRRLRQQRGTLTMLYQAAQRANYLIVTTPTVIYNVDMDKHADRLGTDRGAVDAFSCGVALYLNDVLKQLRWSFKHRDVGGDVSRLSKPFGGYDIGNVMWATANNIRHYDEWDRCNRNPTQKQIDSIEVLAAVMGCALQPKAVNHGFVVMCAWAILERLGTTYYEIELQARRYAAEMVELLGVEQSPYVLEAIKEDTP